MTYEQQKATRAERQKREKRLAELERQIAVLEERKSEIEALMADGVTFSDGQRAREITVEYATLKQKLEAQYATWTEAAEEIGS